MNYKELRTLDVSQFIKKKGKLNYLSWVVAVDQLLQHDPKATWEFPKPSQFGTTMMVYCNLYAFGKKIRMHLPVLSGNNQPISEPNAFQVNTAMMRCLTKAIAAGTGIGLMQLYADEGLPLDEEGVNDFVSRINATKNLTELQQVFAEAFNATKKDKELNKLLTQAKNKRKEELNAGN